MKSEFLKWNMNPNVLSFEKATKFYFFGKKIHKQYIKKQNIKKNYI